SFAESVRRASKKPCMTRSEVSRWATWSRRFSVSSSWTRSSSSSRASRSAAMYISSATTIAAAMPANSTAGTHNGSRSQRFDMAAMEAGDTGSGFDLATGAAALASDAGACLRTIESREQVGLLERLVQDAVGAEHLREAQRGFGGQAVGAAR